MIQEKIVESLMKEILDEKNSLERFKLIEQLDLFARAICSLKHGEVLPISDYETEN